MFSYITKSELTFYYYINFFLTDQLNFSTETELNSVSQFSVSPTEGSRFHDAKELFDSAYALSKHSQYQFRHLLLCLKVSNNATNNYQSCQSLYDFIQLSLYKTSKEPKRVFFNETVDLKKLTCKTKHCI